MKYKKKIIKYLVILFLSLFIFHSFVRWTHYVNYTHMSSKIVKERISYDKIKNPDPDKRYYRKYKIVKTTKSEAFLIVKTTKEKKYLCTIGIDCKCE